MTELKFLEKYRAQSVDELIDMEKEHRIDSLVLAFEASLQRKEEVKGPNSLSDEERVILAIEALEREVNNGGYSQFFYNSSNEYARIIVDSLNKIGCNKVAGITKRAIDALQIKGDINTESIEEAMDSDNEELDKELSLCDDEYYDAGEDIEGNLFDYIKKNRNKIELQKEEIRII